MPASSSDALAVVVVSFNSAEQLPDMTAAVLPQLRDGDELVIVDNGSTDASAAMARSLGDRIRVVETGENLGFAAGCHVGARSTSAPLLLFLNPDCQPLVGCLDALRETAGRHHDWGAWQAAVLLDEARINSDGGVVHYLGIGWAGNCGEPLSALPVEDTHVGFPSGAAMVVRRDAWTTLGGFDEDYFMYGEDLDLGLRLWLAGYGVGLAPSARVRHRYEFDKGSSKWYLLERNRWRTLLSVYPGSLLALLAPAILVAELGLLAVAAREGWLGAKLRAQLAVLKGLPRTLARRREIQGSRRVGADAFARHLTASLDSPYLSVVQQPWLVWPQALYWRVVRGALALLAG